jgi:hypothetical protein
MNSQGLLFFLMHYSSPQQDRQVVTSSMLVQLVILPLFLLLYRAKSPLSTLEHLPEGAN